MPLLKIMLFEKNANKSKKIHFLKKPLVYKKNEIQIKMWFMLKGTLVLDL